MSKKFLSLLILPYLVAIFSVGAKIGGGFNLHLVDIGGSGIGLIGFMVVAGLSLRFRGLAYELFCLAGTIFLFDYVFYTLLDRTLFAILLSCLACVSCFWGLWAAYAGRSKKAI